PPSRPILTRGILVWLAFVGLLMAIGTLSVISWAEQAHGLRVARTMGMVTFALFIFFFSIESKDERDTAFSLDTFSDKTFRITTRGSFVLLVLSTVLGIFQPVMDTVRLDVPQWLICTAVALSVVVAAEIRKALRHRAAAKADQPAGALQAGATTPSTPAGQRGRTQALPVRLADQHNGAVAAQEIDQYLDALEEPKRTTLTRLRQTILDILPEAEQGISYGLPAFKVRGKTIAGFAAFK